MTKRQREQAKPKAKKRTHKGGRKRQNVGFGTLTPFADVTSSLGTLLVTSAVAGCTFDEKALIAMLIGLVLPTIRSIPRASLADAIAKADSANAAKPKPASENPEERQKQKEED